MTTSENAIQQSYEQMGASLRQFTESIVEIQSGESEQFYAMLEYAGKIAAGLRGIGDTLSHQQPDAHTAKEDVVGVRHKSVESVAPFGSVLGIQDAPQEFVQAQSEKTSLHEDANKEISLTPTAFEKTIDEVVALPEKVATLEDTSVASRIGEIAVSRSIMIDGKEQVLTDRQAKILNLLESRAGQKIAPREIFEIIDGTVVAKRQAVRIASHLFERSSSINFFAEGKTNSRRYWVEPQSDGPTRRTDETVIPDQVSIEPARPTPLMMPPRSPQPASNITRLPYSGRETKTDSPPRTLTDWGLVLMQNGHKTLQNGEKLVNCSTGAVDVLLRLAQHPDGLSFTELREQLGKEGRKLDPTDLTSHLQQVEQAFDKLGSPDKFVNTIVEDDLFGTRHVQLIGAVPEEGEDHFLADR